MNQRSKIGVGGHRGAWTHCLARVAKVPVSISGLREGSMADRRSPRAAVDSQRSNFRLVYNRFLTIRDCASCSQLGIRAHKFPHEVEGESRQKSDGRTSLLGTSLSNEAHLRQCKRAQLVGNIYIIKRIDREKIIQTTLSHFKGGNRSWIKFALCARVNWLQNLAVVDAVRTVRGLSHSGMLSLQTSTITLLLKQPAKTTTLRSF
jgi:hypothetical protein